MKNQQKTNSHETKCDPKKDFLLQETLDPELQHVISEVISYSSDYEIHIDNDDIMDWM